MFGVGPVPGPDGEVLGIGAARGGVIAAVAVQSLGTSNDDQDSTAERAGEEVNGHGGKS